MKKHTRTFLIMMLALLLASTIALAQTPKLASDTQPASSSTPAPAPAPQAEQLSFLTLLLRGGWAMMPLALCSLIAVALVIERALVIRKSLILPPDFMAGLEITYNGPADLENALDYCAKRPSSIARIMSAGLRKLPDGVAATEIAIADQGATEVARLRRNLRLLHGMAAITPTLGLLGTVWGMIRAFEAAGRMGLGTHSETLTQGIYEALVATMTGLIIAVPALIAYYFFLSIIDKSIIELNDVTTAFMERHERSILRESVPRERSAVS